MYSLGCIWNQSIIRATVLQIARLFVDLGRQFFFSAFFIKKSQTLVVILYDPTLCSKYLRDLLQYICLRVNIGHLVDDACSLSPSVDQKVIDLRYQSLEGVGQDLRPMEIGRASCRERV